MTALSVLDLMMIGEGKTYADTLEGARLLARHVEQHGYNRYWIAEHHDLPGIGSMATPLIVQHLAAATSTLRVGAGGVMLPNHSPLIVAEQFGTLDTLFPGRIDLGLGRAPGSGGATVRAIRGIAPERDFDQDVQKVRNYLEDNGREAVHALPGRHDIPMWILGSSLQGADLAARLGLPYAFASHFAPQMLMHALAHYRENFRPSAYLQKPYTMAGVNVIAADTRAQAQYLASSHQQWVVRLHAGRPTLLPAPEEGYLASITPRDRQGLDQAMACTAIGDKEDVGTWLREFIATTGVDELMIDARIYDSAARCRSYQLAAESIGDLLTR
ncbi:LLM class flavin-dependent oxidoreductase [Pseudomonas sp. GV071]|uniref:LLM class flavin-dependent oxidoreductase n=1 Tax=Pseudomonas sp. GV071 TaxID=2135754 RepID=UPI000D3C1243|nr:LLM class flavin-dependent oxidoreductase [Pseudomonas sp. GV071]PTQ66742.1 luciferase family oxidoreductase group 1 [Pseudomonas sp. GV071]